MSAAGLRPVPGDGVLSRHGELVVLCAAAADRAELVDAVLAAHEQVAHSHGDATVLADRIAAVLADAADDLNVVVFGPAGGALAVAVFGHAWADVTTEHGEQRLALRQSHNGVRSVLPGTLVSVRAGLGDVDASTEPQRWGDLAHGSVHAGGLLYIAAAAADDLAAAPAPPADSSGPSTAQIPSLASLPTVAMPVVEAEQAEEAEPAHEQPVPPAAPAAATPREHREARAEVVAPPEMPVVAPAEREVDRSQSFSSVVLFSAAGTEPQAPERAPLPIAFRPQPVAPEVAPASHPVDDERPKVMGVYCKNGHFDDPSARYCAICGISMVQQTLLPRLGPRPPLGVLVLDEGSILSLDTDYVIGRDPARDTDVAAGTARQLRIEDPEGVLSRIHARIALSGWQVQVIDLGSANGTRVWGPRDTTWRPIPPQTPTAIVPGTQVGFGRRQLRYESHRNT